MGFWRKRGTGATVSRRQLEAENLQLRLRVAELEARLAEKTCANCARLEARILQLEEQVARLSKNSSTSSKPPSSDIVKPPSPSSSSGEKRKIGGQPQHSKHERQLFPPDQVDDTKQYTLECCPSCHGKLRPLNAALEVVQQAEFVQKPIYVVEHQALGYECCDCGEICQGLIPEEIKKAGLLGPRLTALVGEMKGECHASFTTIQKFFFWVLGFKVARGYLCKVVDKVGQALQFPYDELLLLLRREKSLHTDETGHNGRKYWTWCFRALDYVLFKIDKSRGSQVLIETLGKEFNGVLGCDFFSAYRKYMKAFNGMVQFCMAHLIREVKFITTLTDTPANAYGDKLLSAIREMFAVIHQRETLTEAVFKERLEETRKRILKVACTDVPLSKACRLIAKRFKEHGEAYFRFITTPGIEPTNNIAEQAIRFVVIDRHITQGTRSEKGRRVAERLWTMVGTCTLQKRSVFNYLVSAMKAYFSGQPVPSLLPRPP